MPIACTLTGDQRAERIGHWQRLLAQAARREPVEGGVRVELPVALAGEAAESGTAEQRCCAFLEFTLRPAGETLRLEVRAPAEAAPLLAEVFGA